MTVRPKQVEDVFGKIGRAIHGWEICPEEWLGPMIAQARLYQGRLPDEFREEAEKLILPLTQRV